MRTAPPKSRLSVPAVEALAWRDRIVVKLERMQSAGLAFASTACDFVFPDLVLSSFRNRSRTVRWPAKGDEASIDR